MKDIRIYYMRFIVINERGETISRNTGFTILHPGQELIADAIEAYVKHPHWTDLQLSGRRILPLFGVN